MRSIIACCAPIRSEPRLEVAQVPRSRATSLTALSAAVVAQPALDRVHIYLPEGLRAFEEPASTPETIRIG
jgi:hypothetical protein